MSAGTNDTPRPFFDVTTVGAHDTSGASIIHQDEYPKYDIADGVVFCPVFATNMSLNFVTFPPDSGFPMHTHPEEQISIVRAGSMEITAGELTRVVGPGDVIVFPSGVPHAGRTFADSCQVIDVFSPSREGMKELIASADPLRSADVDSWWRS